MIFLLCLTYFIPTFAGKMVTSDLFCNFCHLSFGNEDSLISHNCEGLNQEESDYEILSDSELISDNENDGEMISDR